MSYVIDAVNRFNEMQLKAVVDGQDAVIDVVKKTADYLDRNPEAPEPFQKLVEPVEAFVGNPVEVVRTVAETNKEWAQVWVDFHSKVSDVLAPVSGSVAAAATPIKKSGAARGANA